MAAMAVKSKIQLIPNMNRAEEMPAQDIVQSFNRPSIKKTNY